MKVARYRSYDLVILTRNEHCPPHVHVGGSTWEARFKFSFWHDSVCLWDVVPERKAPKSNVLESLRQTLEVPGNLRRARELWWQTRQTICVDNLLWDVTDEEVVTPRNATSTARKIVLASFDATQYQTNLQLQGEQDPVEIEL